MYRGTRSLGFTLIELLIVVAILGILAAIGVPMVSGYITDSKNSAVEAGLRSIYLAEQDYKREMGSYYTPGTVDQKANDSLFSGKEILNLTEHDYSIARNGSNGFTVTGGVKGSSCKITITHLNKMSRNGCD